MKKNNIVIKQKVEAYLYLLIEKLNNEKYFTYTEDAINYVNSLRNDIKEYLPNLQARMPDISPIKWIKDLRFIAINNSNRTTWYVYFTVHGSNKDIYIIHHISNNHVAGHKVSKTRKRNLK